jgi:hypothetical protein
VKRSDAFSERRASVGIWIELGVFLLVFVFAAWQFHDLKREKQKRLARQAEAARSTTDSEKGS